MGARLGRCVLGACTCRWSVFCLEGKQPGHTVLPPRGRGWPGGCEEQGKPCPQHAGSWDRSRLPLRPPGLGRLSGWDCWHSLGACEQCVRWEQGKCRMPERRCPLTALPRRTLGRHKDRALGRRARGPCGTLASHRQSDWDAAAPCVQSAPCATLSA